MKRRGIAPLIPILVLLLAAGPTAVAQDRDDLQQIEDRIGRIEGLIRQANAERKGLLAQIAESDRRRGRLSARIAELGLELEDAEGRLRTVQASLDVVGEELRIWTGKLGRANESLVDQELVLDARASAAYRLGPAGLVDLVLGSEDLSSLTDSVQFVSSVISTDSALLQGIRVAKAQVAEYRGRVSDAQDRLTARRDVVRDGVRRIRRLKAENEALRAEVEQEIATRESLLDDVERSKAKYVAAVKELEAESARIRALLLGTASTGSGQPGGQLLWPTAGSIVSGFGWRVHPIFNTRRFHSGVDIDGACWQPIWAVEDGVVISSGWNGGYGQAVVIDHGDGLATLYAHQSSLGVGAGQEVSRGQVIGAVGTTGWSTGCHLHFEVRVNGSPVDPVPYIT